MNRKNLCFIFLVLYIKTSAQLLPGFEPVGSGGEQQLLIENCTPGTRILINAPISGIKNGKEVQLVLYALPNGNTIEHTFGKKTLPSDDWHFDIQHIGAQTRFLRKILGNQILVVAYLENRQKSWPAWKAQTIEYKKYTTEIIERIKSVFPNQKLQIVLNGHSGGGRFIFSYLDTIDEIPDEIVRIAFLDSNYGYEDSLYHTKLTRWLKSGKEKFLCTLAYNDSVVVYKEKPLVSPTGGTWYRSKLLQKNLSEDFGFQVKEKDSLIWYTALKNRIEIILKPNPENKIYHTVLVERNGFIHSMLSGTKYEQKGYSYFGQRAYSSYISDTVIIPVRCLNIPPRKENAETGSKFMQRILSLPLTEREKEIENAIISGNIPNFLRNTVTLNDKFYDSNGVLHTVIYEVFPDYLSIGNDLDFCRIPMNPFTAQRIADTFGCSLITSKISDHIFEKSEVRLEPFFYKPQGNKNELVSKFMEHNQEIANQIKNRGGKKGQLIAGIKKDVIISNRIAKQPDKVVIYGWHKPDGVPVQPVYSGHIWWYVDYSHGIRLVNNQVLIDGKSILLSELLKDPVLFKIFSNEEFPMEKTSYQK